MLVCSFDNSQSEQGRALSRKIEFKGTESLGVPNAVSCGMCRLKRRQATGEQ